MQCVRNQLGRSYIANAILHLKIPSVSRHANTNTGGLQGLTMQIYHELSLNGKVGYSILVLQL